VWVREEFPAKIEEFPMEPNKGLLLFSAFEPEHDDVFGLASEGDSPQEP